MPNQSRASFAILRGAVGATLRALARDQYLFNGQPDTEDEASLEMRFDGGLTILLFLASDGESVGTAAEKLELAEPFTLDTGAECAWQRIDLGRMSGFERLIGQAVVEVDAVIDTWADPPGAEVVWGWVVRFKAGDFLAYLNTGDDTRILLNELPLHPDPSIRTRIERIGQLGTVEPSAPVDPPRD